MITGEVAAQSAEEDICRVLVTGRAVPELQIEALNSEVTIRVVLTSLSQNTQIAYVNLLGDLFKIRQSSRRLVTSS